MSGSVISSSSPSSASDAVPQSGNGVDPDFQAQLSNAQAAAGSQEQSGSTGGADTSGPDNPPATSQTSQNEPSASSQTSQNQPSAPSPNSSKQPSGSQKPSAPSAGGSLTVGQQKVGVDFHGSIPLGQVLSASGSVGTSYNPENGQFQTNESAELAARLGPSTTSIKLSDQQGGAATSQGDTAEIQEKVNLGKGDSVGASATHGPQGDSVEADGTAKLGDNKIEGKITDKLDGKNPGPTFEGSVENDRGGGNNTKFDFKYTPAQAERQMTLSDTEQLTSKVAVTGTISREDGGKTPGNGVQAEADFKVTKNLTLKVDGGVESGGKAKAGVGFSVKF